MLWSVALKHAIHDRLITTSDYEEKRHDEALDRVVSDLTQNRMKDNLPFSSTRHWRNGRLCLSINDPLDRIIDQVSAAWLKKALGVTTYDRNRQVEGLVASAAEYGPAHVYRYDVSSFFESFDLEKIIVDVFNRERVSGPARIALVRYLKTAQDFSCEGLPRGLSLSSVLSDYAMKNVDRELANDPSVYFYGRFVDDIIVLRAESDSGQSFEDLISPAIGALPGVFRANENKSGEVSLVQKNGEIDRSFCYLGYQFSPPSHESHPFSIDMTAGKEKKIKAKIASAFVNYLGHKDFRVLKESLQVLASNTLLVRRGVKSRAMFVGIYYSYPHITCDTYNYGRLASLDKFVRSLVYGSKTSLSKKLSKSLTKAERADLVRVSFVAGHRDRVFHRVSRERARKLIQGWSDGV